MAHDLALKPSQLINIQYDALADVAAFWREDGDPASRNVNCLERIFSAATDHVAAQQFQFRAGVPAFLTPRFRGRAQNGHRRLERQCTNSIRNKTETQNSSRWLRLHYWRDKSRQRAGTIQNHVAARRQIQIRAPLRMRRLNDQRDESDKHRISRQSFAPASPGVSQR
jgi:hypothetical protein